MCTDTRLIDVSVTGLIFLARDTAAGYRHRNRSDIILYQNIHVSINGFI
jgi:hypothetical protein